MLFEFIEFKHNANEATQRMPVQGPGMTHTCFQTASNNSGYDKFRDAGADILLYHPKTPSSVSLIVQAKNHNTPLPPNL